MLLAYEYDYLLINPENKARVQEILKELDKDFVTEEILKYHNTLIDELKDLGEINIYNKLHKS